MPNYGYMINTELNYMCLTANFINNWHLHKRIHNFCIAEKPKGPTLSKFVEQCLIEYGINHILTVTTTDNASTNIELIDFITKNVGFAKIRIIFLTILKINQN